MRKGIKIKASFVFLSWLMIFVHGIIPHSHYDDVPFHHEFHNKGCIEEGSSVLINSHAEDEDGCRISNLLFHKFTQDDHQFVVSQVFATSFIADSRPVIYNNHYTFLSGRYSDTESLRAPPCA